MGPQIYTRIGHSRWLCDAEQHGRAAAVEKVPAEHLSRKAEKDQLLVLTLPPLATMTMSHPTKHW